MNSRRIPLIEEGIPAREIIATKKFVRSKKIMGAILIFAILMMYAMFLLSPFYTIFITSFVNQIDLQSTNSFIWWPRTWSFDGFKNLFTYSPMPDEISVELLFAFGNTFLIAIITSVSSLFFSGMAAFAYSKIRFKGSNALFFVQLCTMMIPAATLTVPSFIFFNQLGWTKGELSYLPVVLPAMFGGATVIFFLRSYMTSIPDEVIEAAKIDGLSPFKTYLKIIIPEAFPAFIAQFIFAFVASYNSYLKPLLYLADDPHHYTLQIFLQEYSGTFKANPNYLCSSVLVALVPLILIFIVTQKFFIEGVTVGGGKE
ncbi:MAG: carbohydrate ABC transporter permease [Bacilli bacterium]|nr:carbohydrate ABC transporter permease [Bacilli bacterium]